MNNINYNELITLEEAENLLTFVKRIYNGKFDGVTIEYGDVFAYYPDELVITIPEYFDEDDEEIGMRILKHVNDEFGAEFEYNLRVMSIQAILHECGHHIDFEGKIFTNDIEEYLIADSMNKDIFYSITEEFGNKVKEYADKIDEYEAREEYDEETEFRLEENRLELVMEEREIDKLYRMIPTEYAADEFSARFFMTYMRGYKKAGYGVL